MKTKFTLFQRAVGLLLLCFSVSLSSLQAQLRVGQPAGSPDGSAALDVSGGPYANGSTYRGIAPPKVALTQTSIASPVTNPATGLLVYNTAKVGDVTPGYYYWEGSKWLRFTTSSVGAARVAGVNGQSIPAYLISQVSSSTIISDIIYIADPGREGMFRYVSGSSPTSTTAVGAVSITTISGHYDRILTSGTVSVKWFGAKGDANTDDAPAIQAAVNYAKSYLSTFNAITVEFPDGIYRINTTINCTNADGLKLRGGGGNRRFNVSIIGMTSGLMFDFTGASDSGMEGLNLSSPINTVGASTIGVLLALGGSPERGLNCIIRNCEFGMADNPNANNNIGTIAIANSRAEEVTISDCFIRANIGAIFTNNPNLSTVGYNFTLTSPYTNVTQGQGSMGVINFDGQNSFHCVGKVSPALILNGTNDLSIKGAYFGRDNTASAGTNDYAFFIGGSVNYNLNISATIESYSSFRIKGGLINSDLNIVNANLLYNGNSSSFPTGTTKPAVFDVTGAGQLIGNKFSLVFGDNNPEAAGRYLFYDGNTSGAYLLNNIITCPQVQSNTLVASANLLANSNNTSYLTGDPYISNQRINTLKVPNNLLAGRGSATNPVYRFVDSPTGMYLGDNGETGFRGPSGSATVSSYLFGTSGNNELTLDAGSSSNYSRINFSKGGVRQWSLTNGNGQDFYISKEGLSATPFVIESAGAIHINSGISYPFAEKNANYTLTDNDYTVVCNGTPGAFTITVPSSAGRIGRVYVIKKGDPTANTITIKAPTGQYIENSNSYTLSTLNQTITIQSNGNGAWTIIGKVN